MYNNSYYQKVSHKCLVIRNISEIVVYRNIAYRNGSATTQDLITANQKNIFKESFVGSWAAAHTSLYQCYSLKFPLNKEIEYYEVTSRVTMIL